MVDESITPAIEKKYVHGVYDAIASHFSSTRFAKWPKVASFLESLVPGSLIMDAGCGNGKYLGLNPRCFFLGCDLSSPLVSICSQRGNEVLVADTLRLPYRTGSFDAAISIAVLHHLSTQERRKKAIEELARVVVKEGKVLITVWAVEQEDKTLLSKWTPLTSKYSEEWVGAAGRSKSSKQLTAPLQSIEEQEKEDKTLLFKGTPLASKYSEEWIGAAGRSTSSKQLTTPLQSIDEQEKEDKTLLSKGTPLTSKYSEEWVGAAGRSKSSKQLTAPLQSIEEQEGASSFADMLKMVEEVSIESNPETLSTKQTVCDSVKQQDYFVPWHLPYHRAEIAEASAGAVATGLARKDDTKAAVVYDRYYHVFAKGELERLVAEVDGVTIFDSFFDKSNWCVILQKA